MSDDLRNASIVALCALGRSSDYRDRADAGRGLAGFAETREVFDMLMELVLDAEDTFVTRATAEAVLRRKDKAGLLVVASALEVADSNHGDWIHAAIVDVFGIFSRDRDSALRICEDILQDSSERPLQGTRQLVGILTDIEPILFSAEA